MHETKVGKKFFSYMLVSANYFSAHDMHRGVENFTC